MIVDGATLAVKIREDLKKQIQKLKRIPVLAIVIVGDHPASRQYVAKKKFFGEQIGSQIKLLEYPADITNDALQAEIKKQVLDPDVSGIIIQLPLPKHLNTQDILHLVSSEKDVDALASSPLVLSPVVAAIKAVFDYYQINLSNQKIVVVGKGKLVGQPAYLWLSQSGQDVEVVDSSDKGIVNKIKEADILILGTGQPHLIKPDMIKDGVVIIDAGTSEANSKLKGDADPACAAKSSFFTPVPGGIGPLTVAMLFSNLLNLVKYQLNKDEINH